MALPEIVQANPFAAYNQGVQAKNALAAQADQIQARQDAMNQRNALSSALSQAYSGDRTGAQNALAQSAPLALPDYQAAIGQMDANKASQLQASNQAIFRKVQEISQLPPEQRQPAYAAAKAKLVQDGGDVSWLPDDVDSGLKVAYSHVASIDQLIQQSGLPSGNKGVVLSAGGRLVDPVTGHEIANNPAAQKADAIVSVGVPGGTQQFYNTPQGLRPIGGGSPTGVTDPDSAIQGFMKQASDMVNQGYMTKEQGDRWLQAQVNGVGSTDTPGVSAGGGLGFTPAKPNAGQDQYRPATSDEIKAAGLPSGSAGQVNTSTGKLEVLSKPAQLSPDKQADVAAKRQKAEAARQQSLNSVQDSISKIDSLLGDKNFGSLGTFSGDFLGRIPHSGVADASAALDTIGNQSVLNTIGELKSLSATGASGFGSLSNQEGEMLRNAAANLSKSQSNAALRKNLIDLRSKLVQTQNRINSVGSIKLPEDTVSEGSGTASGDFSHLWNSN